MLILVHPQNLCLPKLANYRCFYLHFSVYLLLYSKLTSNPHSLNVYSYSNMFSSLINQQLGHLNMPNTSRVKAHTNPQLCYPQHWSYCYLLSTQFGISSPKPHTHTLSSFPIHCKTLRQIVGDVIITIFELLLCVGSLSTKFERSIWNSYDLMRSKYIRKELFVTHTFGLKFEIKRPF